MHRVVVTGIGLVTPVGIGTDASWKALLAGQSGVAPITSFDATSFRVRIAAQVRDWHAERFVDAKRRREIDRFTEFALGAARLAVDDAGLVLTDEEREEAGCIVGVALGGLAAGERMKEMLEDKGPTKISPYSVPRTIANMGAAHISMTYGLHGPSLCTTSACASGAHALGEAFEWIRRGRATVMLAGGAEATITPVGIGGFEAMLALSRRNDDPTRASRPFDRARDGFVCGEGSAMLVLETLERATARGARIYAELTGYGSSSDAYHLTHPAPEGEGAQRAMRRALADARVNASDVAYLNAHATSTPSGDSHEARAIARVFGDWATDATKRGPRLWVSATKSMVGHLLGAAGALESAICALAVHEGRVPPTINLDEPDPECGPLDFVPHAARERRVDHALNNSFGYGGTNCALLFSRVA